MTRKEMTEIFSVMSLAWPNAEMFKGGVERLGPTITLWASCLPDVDFWTAQQAVVRLCRECKFPPTIAELREAAETVQKNIRHTINQQWEYFKLAANWDLDKAKALINGLPAGDETKMVVMAMGGPDALVIEDERGRLWNFDGFRDAYIALIRKDPALAGGVTLALPGRGKEQA